SLNLCQVSESTPHPSLDTYYILLYKYCVLRYETRAENPLPPRGRGLAARSESSHDPTRACGGGPKRARQEHQPVIYLANRKRIEAAHDAILAFAIGQV